MTRTSFALTLAATLATSLVVATPAAAQGRGQNDAENRANRPVDRSILTVPGTTAESRNDGRFDGVARIPRGHLPPRGMCRIWIDGVPPGRQASPMDCRTAVRTAPQHARVIDSEGNTYRGGWYGDRDDRDRDCRVRDRRGNYERDRNGDYRYDRDCMRDRDDRWDRDDRDRWDRDDWCLDRNHDGRCDNGGGRVNDPRNEARRLPEMISTILLESGRRSEAQERWFGSQRVTARYVDANRNRIPERITWLDASGRVLQVWVDNTRDGRADTVELYRNGRPYRVIR